MITPAYVRLMARYNRWQNVSIFKAAESLTDDARRMDRGAFFHSIHETLSHLLWGDSIWMHRFAGLEKPAGGIEGSASLFDDWTDLAIRRDAMDAHIVLWSDDVREDWLGSSTSWTTSSTHMQMSKPNWLLATHFFNHQTHHRGQVHAMLTAAGAKPDRTDLVFMETQVS